MIKRKFNMRLYIIALIIFINVAGNGLILPLLPFMAENLGANPITIGLFLSTYPFFSILAGPYLGLLSDKYGRKPILLFSIAGTIIGFFILSIAKSLPLLFLARIIDGASAGNTSTAKAAIADISSKEERVSKLGIIFAAESLGLIMGPLIGGFFAGYGFSVSALIAAFIALLCFILTLFLFAETKDFLNKYKTSKKKSAINFKEMFSVLKSSDIKVLIFIIFIVQFLITMMWGSLALYAKRLFGFSGKEMGYISAFAASIGIFSQVIILRYLIKIAKEKVTLFVGLIAMGIGMIFLSISNFVALLLIGVGLMAGCFNVLMPTVTGMISKLSTKSEQGKVMGTVSSVMHIGSLLGPVISTSIYSISMRGNYMIGAVIALASAILSLKTRVRIKTLAKT